MEQGRPFSLDDLSPATAAALGAPPGHGSTPSPGTGPGTPARPRNSTVKNARAWASAAAGEDLAGQIDPEFTLGQPASERLSHERMPESARR